MPKNKGKGGKSYKKRKKATEETQRELILCEADQDYARVEKLVGDARLTARSCTHGKDFVCKIRGKMRRRVWINSGDLILVSLRDFGDDALVDVIHKYDQTEVRLLQKLGEIGDIKNMEFGEPDEDDVFDFDEI